MILFPRGRRYELVRVTDLRDKSGDRCDGLCDSPYYAHPQIQIDAALSGRDELETYLHELDHSLEPMAVWQDETRLARAEIDTTRRAKFLAAVLWRLGYRRSE